MPLVLVLKLAVALPLMLFLPGFMMARAVLPKLDRAEVVALAPSLSIAALALALLVIEKTAERFTAENVTRVIVLLNLCSFLLALVLRRVRRQRTLQDTPTRDLPGV